MAKTLLSLSCFLLFGLASSSPMERGSGNLCDICGKSPLYPSTKIYNGRLAHLGEFPWRVLVRNEVEQGSCGGTIISKNLVLTAGHCVPTVIKGQESSVNMTIRAGTVYMWSAPQTFSVDGSAITRHKGYIQEPTEVENDIALIRIPGPGFDFSNPNVAPNCLPYRFQRNILSGTAVASGWGITGPDQQTEYMKMAPVKIGEEKECNRILNQKGLYGNNINNEKMCLTSAETGICSGDSGGSIDVQINGRFYAVGINSYVIAPCGDPGNVDVVQKVGAFLKWIEDNAGESFCTN